MKRSTIITIVIAVLIVLWGIGAYNGMVRANTGVDTQWAQVENQFQRRLDLIPNLVSTVKGATKEELAFVDAVTGARAAYGGAKTTDEKAAAASNLEGAIGRLLVVVEANPQIATLPAFQNLMVDLEGTENRIAVERGRYNDAVNTMNVKVKTFPSNIIAKLFGFGERTLFKAAEGADQAPQVNF